MLLDGFVEKINRVGGKAGEARLSSLRIMCPPCSAIRKRSGSFMETISTNPAE
jgi:hypothetical protein